MSKPLMPSQAMQLGLFVFASQDVGFDELLKTFYGSPTLGAPVTIREAIASWGKSHIAAVNGRTLLFDDFLADAVTADLVNPEGVRIPFRSYWCFIHLDDWRGITGSYVCTIARVVDRTPTRILTCSSDGAPRGPLGKTGPLLAEERKVLRGLEAQLGVDELEEFWASYTEAPQFPECLDQPYVAGAAKPLERQHVVARPLMMGLLAEALGVEITSATLSDATAYPVIRPGE